MSILLAKFWRNESNHSPISPRGRISFSILGGWDAPGNLNYPNLEVQNGQKEVLVQKHSFDTVYGEILEFKIQPKLGGFGESPIDRYLFFGVELSQLTVAPPGLLPLWYGDFQPIPLLAKGILEI